MYLLVIVLLISYVRTQQDLCSCSCCTGQLCSPVLIGTSYIQSCTIDSCRAYCRNSYGQCQIDYPNGQVVPQCLINTSTISPLYNCQCNCCKTGFITCSPFFVGYSTTYQCQSSSCSISCFTQYPNHCPSDYTGQTNGICIGPITTAPTTTTTVSTTSGYWSGSTCSCMCCQSGPNCSPTIEVGNIVAPQCSSASCTAACQNQYPSACPSFSYFGQTNGICTSQNSGNTRCRCQCCGMNGCPSYDVYTNGGCTSCDTLCQQRCGNTNPMTYTCDSNRSTKSIQFSFPLIIFISIIILPFHSIL